jgi:hypothetical protein
LFDQLRTYLRAKKDPYADNHQFGDGPNWRLRAIRQALTLLGMRPDTLRHGLTREVFVSHLAENAVDVLIGKEQVARFNNLLVSGEVAELAKKRWILPRAQRDSRFKQWQVDALFGQSTLQRAEESH